MACVIDKLLKRDFDAAVKFPWSSKTCLLAQAEARGVPADRLWGMPRASSRMQIFDNNFRTPGDEKKNRALKRLRASLPVTL